MDFRHPMTLLKGSEKPLPSKKKLKAGMLTCNYESGMIRYISAGDTELIRCIYSAVRDRNWGTLLPVISGEQITTGEDHFTIAYHAEYRDASIHFEADYRIDGTADNRIHFTMSGQAVNTFQKNRIGFCILHPLRGITGKTCTVTGPDGTVKAATFPEGVGPDAPMKDISGMKWENETAKCRLSFQGDIWEMEDQRNWTDSSFKTFCTPLTIPYPATLEKGSVVKQTVTFEAQTIKPIGGIKKGAVSIIPETLQIQLPLIGVGLSSHQPAVLTKTEAAILRHAGLYHLRHDVKFCRSDWRQNLETAASNAHLIGTKLELALHFSEQASDDLAAIGQLTGKVAVPVEKFWAINERSRLSDNKLLETVIRPLKLLFPKASAGGGTDAYFAEFNRNPFRAGELDFVTFAASPQVHAFDNDSLAENMESQCDVIRSAKSLYPGKLIQVSPVTLRQRFNAVATGEDPPEPEDQLPYPVDLRQMSLFAAGWTLGSILALARGGAAWVTYYQATGWQGIIQGDAGPEKPALFAGRQGDIFPVYHLLRLLCQKKCSRVFPCEISEPLACSALVIPGRDSDLMVVANHTGDTLNIKTEGFNPAMVACWNASNVAQGFSDPEFLRKLPFEKVTGSVLFMEPYSFLFLKNSKEQT